MTDRWPCVEIRLRTPKARDCGAAGAGIYGELSERSCRSLSRSLPDSGALLARTAALTKLTKLFFVGIAVLVTFVVGVTRVYLGLHYPTDVAAGWCIGAAWAMFCWAAALYLQRRGEVERPNGLVSTEP